MSLLESLRQEGVANVTFSRAPLMGDITAPLPAASRNRNDEHQRYGLHRLVLSASGLQLFPLLMISMRRLQILCTAAACIWDHTT
jgi:hypothetical protein